ncbi:PDZ domain-containing protein [Ornithinibacillus sp. L9]|uniref:PDZ domain-containing protein n=1 Tax=Ornithinibacillus caprae TaxID=2678566 RepID=A0A6N8FGJ5_9BACI|nr:SRPBCC domain-containing protein [Ornithinibacillus caprae]MUK88575.1 PDZ domain-containing protein [Ornithinibacillus caprae]
MSKVESSVKRDIVVHAPLKKVWDALTKPEHLNRWYTKEANIDFRVGGYGEMQHGWGVTSSGIYTEIEELHRFVLEGKNGDFKTITTLEEVDDGVCVTIEYQTAFHGEEGESAKENMLYGTYQFLKNLKSVYESNRDNRSKMWRTSIGIMHRTHASGSKVLKVGKTSAAREAGILAGDVIVAVDGEPVNGYDSLENIIHSKEVNTEVQLIVKRDEELLKKDCKITSYPVPY